MSDFGSDLPLDLFLDILLLKKGQIDLALEIKEITKIEVFGSLISNIVLGVLIFINTISDIGIQLFKGKINSIYETEESIEFVYLLRFQIWAQLEKSKERGFGLLISKVVQF